MSTSIMAACWPLQMPPTQKAVLISLADNANDQGHCWPSIPTISERTCFSERAVHRAIRWLEEHGLVTADRSNGRHTRYVITPESFSAPESAAEPPHLRHPRISGTTADAAVQPPQMRQEPPQMRQEPLPEVRSNRKEPSRTTKKATTRPKKLTFDQWMESLHGSEAVPAADPIFDWAEKAGIPDSFLELAWLAFADRFTENEEKTYANWRATFRNYVKNGWLDLWRVGRAGEYELTDIGLQWDRVRQAEQREAA